MARSKKKKTGWIIFMILVIAVAGGAAYFMANKPKEVNAEDDYTVTQATKTTIETSLESSGEITSSLEENVEPHTSYYLDEIKVEEGQALKEGDVILTYTNDEEMTAPYNCVIKGWSLPESEEQLTSDHYVTIAGTDVLQMTISVNESNIADLELGDKATVTVDATGGTYDAEVSYISQVGSYSGGNSSFSARVTFDNDGKLKLGMSGTATVSLEKAENVIAVPAGAVNKKGPMSFVTTVDESGEMSQVQVETGISNDSFIEIKSGLNEGDSVVVTSSDDSSSGFPSEMPGGMSGMPDFGGSGSGFTHPSGGSGGSGSFSPPSGFGGSGSSRSGGN